MLRLGRDLAVGEFAHLVADRGQGFVQPAIADGGVAMAAHQFDEPGAPPLTGRHQAFQRPLHALGHFAT